MIISKAFAVLMIPAFMPIWVKNAQYDWLRDGFVDLMERHIVDVFGNNEMLPYATFFEDIDRRMGLRGYFINDITVAC